MKLKILSLFLCFNVFAYCQYFSDNFLYGGVSFNKYIYGLTPFEIYSYDINQLSSNTKKYGKIDLHPGIIAGAMFGANKVQGKIEYSFNRKVSSASYSVYNIGDSTIFEIDEKLKISNAIFKVGVFYSPSNFRKFSIGTTIDIGIFKNSIKRKGGFYSGNWEKFYTETGLGNDYRSRSFTGSVGINISYFITKKMMLTLCRNFTMADAQYNKLTNLKDFSVNSQHYQLSLSYAFGD